MCHPPFLLSLTLLVKQKQRHQRLSLKTTMRTVETLTRLTEFLQGSYQSRAVDGTTGLTAKVSPLGYDSAIARVEAVLIRRQYVELWDGNSQYICGTQFRNR